MSGSEWLHWSRHGQLADPALLTELHELAPDTTGDLPWP
jgi:hypothetical protein